MPERYSPKWAEHVVGEFEKKYEDDGSPARIIVALSCSKCGETARVPCWRGAPRQKVAAWAVSHVHRDVMAVKKGGEG